MPPIVTVGNAGKLGGPRLKLKFGAEAVDSWAAVFSSLVKVWLPGGNFGALYVESL